MLEQSVRWLVKLWLVGLGVQMRFIRKRPPLEHSRIERHHQTIAAQAFQGQTFADVSDLQYSLQARLLFLNQNIQPAPWMDSLPSQPFRTPDIPVASTARRSKSNCSTCNAFTLTCKVDAGFGKSVRLARFDWRFGA